jgi:hypothetical protein
LYQHLLTCTNKSDQIEKLAALSQKFFSLRKELTLVNSGLDTVNKFDYLIFRFSKDLLEMMKIIGANKCSNILELVLGEDYKDSERNASNSRNTNAYPGSYVRNFSGLRRRRGTRDDRAQRLRES